MITHKYDVQQTICRKEYLEQNELSFDQSFLSQPQCSVVESHFNVYAN